MPVKKFYFGKSRFTFTNEKIERKEKEEEEKLLEKIDILPDEMILLIYGFITTKAKLYFNPKFIRLNSEVDFYTFPKSIKTLFNKMTDDELAFFLFRGTLIKYPEIVNALFYSYDYNYYMIRKQLATIIWDYIWIGMIKYRTELTRKPIKHKKYHKLLLKMEKVYYLYRVIMIGLG